MTRHERYALIFFLFFIHNTEKKNSTIHDSSRKTEYLTNGDLMKNIYEK